MVDLCEGSSLWAYFLGKIPADGFMKLFLGNRKGKEYCAHGPFLRIVTSYHPPPPAAYKGTTLTFHTKRRQAT
jgi:hypothetical protein